MPNSGFRPPTTPPPNWNEFSQGGRGGGMSSLGDIVQTYREFYTSILNQGDAQLLQKTFSHQRELSKQIEDKVERGIFLAILKQIEGELLPSESESNAGNSRIKTAAGG